MTRSRRAPTPTPPLTERIRSAITGAEWRSLSDLDALASTRSASDQRRAVHAALRELRAGGMTLEERVGAGGVEVRAGLVETPAQAMEAVRTELDAALLHGPADDGPGVVILVDELPEPFGPEAPTLPAPVPDGYEPAPTPGPGARCATCDVPFARHATADHPFTPRKRGAPPGPRQRRMPGPGSEARIERAGGPRLAPVGAEGEEERRMREEAALADVRPATAEEIAETDARFGGALTAFASGAPIEEVIARASGGHVVPGWRTEVMYRAEVGPCRPPACHYLSIHDPSRVPLDKLPPLCEAHRGWVLSHHPTHGT